MNAIEKSLCEIDFSISILNKSININNQYIIFLYILFICIHIPILYSNVKKDKLMIEQKRIFIKRNNDKSDIYIKNRLKILDKQKHFLIKYNFSYPYRFPVAIALLD